MTDTPVAGGRSGVIAAVLLLGAVVVTAMVVAPVPVGASDADADAATAQENCDPVDRSEREGDVLAATGCLSEGERATITYEPPEGAERVVVAMRGPAGTDFDLLVTLDGSPPTAENHDLISQGSGSAERIVVDSVTNEIAVAVRATGGEGRYALQVRANGSEGNGSVVADYTVTPSQPSVNEPVRFAADTDAAGPDASYTWKFPDGTTASGPVVNHTFSSVGTQRVRLTVSGPDGEDTLTREIAVTGASSEPQASFSVTPSEPATGETVTLDASDSSGANATYVWEFPDGTTARGEAVQHTFTSAGRHEVRLSVVTDTGTDTAVRAVRVVDGDRSIVPRLQIDTRDDDGVIYAGQAVRFSGAASTADAGVARYGFEFGDGTTAYGAAPRVAHRYDSPGNYTVRLHVTDENGDTQTVTREVRVVEPRVAVTDLSGLEDPVFEPIGLFANCGEVGTIRVETAGTEPVQRVEFTVRGETYVDDTPDDGWTMPRGRFPTPGRVIKVTAVTESGRTDTVTAPVELADAPDGVVGYLVNANLLIKGYNHVNREGGDIPASVGNCELTITWPTWSKDVSDTFRTDGNYTLPDGVTQFVKPPDLAVFATQFRLRYRPGQQQVTVGGTGSTQLILPPKETNAQGAVSVNGAYTVPEWDLQQVTFAGLVDGNYHLEDWLVPLPTTEVEFDLDGEDGPLPGAKVGLPLDIIFGPEMRVTGGIAPSFDPDTVEARLQGELSLRGQAGGRIAAIDTPFGEYEVEASSAWAEGALQTDRLQVVPFDPTIAGRFFVNYGVKVDVPFIPESIIDPYKWEKTHEWQLQPSLQNGGVAAGLGPGAAAVQMSAAHDVETDAGRSPEPHRSDRSPGATLDADPVADTGASEQTGNVSAHAGDADAAIATGAADGPADAKKKVARAALTSR